MGCFVSCTQKQSGNTLVVRQHLDLPSPIIKHSASKLLIDVDQDSDKGEHRSKELVVQQPLDHPTSTNVRENVNDHKAAPRHRGFSIHLQGRSRKMKHTTHVSLHGHVQVYRFFTQLGMTLLCHEEEFFLPQVFRPDLIFSWGVNDQQSVYVVAEVTARFGKGGNRKKLRRQCHRAMQFIPSCCAIGLLQQQNGAMLVLEICGSYSSQLRRLIQNHGGASKIYLGK